MAAALPGVEIVCNQVDDHLTVMNMLITLVVNMLMILMILMILTRMVITILLMTILN